MHRFLLGFWRWLRAEIVFGFMIASVFWAVVLGWQAAYAPTYAEKQKCYDVAHNAGHKNEECKSLWEKTTSDPVAFFTLVLAVSTIGLWVATVFLYRAGERQFRHVRRSAAIQSRDMQASIEVAQQSAVSAKRAADIAERGVVEADRPWIEVGLKINGPLIFGPESIEIEGDVTITNIGKSPAINVTCDFRMCCDIAEAMSEASDMASRSRRASAIGTLNFGQVIFPGKSLNFTAVKKLSRPQFLARIKEFDDRGRAEGGDGSFDKLNPALMAYVSYALAAAGRLGTYRWSTGLMEICLIRDRNEGFDGSEATFPLDQIELNAPHWGAGEFS
jgi:hypothetical protein